MPTTLDRNKVKQHLENFDLRSLFIQELGWDHGGAHTEATVADRTFVLEAIAHKRGLVAYQYVADSDDAFLDYPTRRKIEKSVAKTVHEHIIVYASHDRNAQYWQWVKREPGRPDRLRQHIYHRGQPGEALTQRLEQIAFTLEEEDDLTIVNVSGRVRAAFDVEKVTKKFYERFKKEQRAFLGFIEGIENMADREWYASLMLNRMMFIYFIQKRGFLDGDTDYLRNRLERVRQQQGGGKFISFYRLFLLRLFHEGLGQPEADRSPELAALLGRVPYLNGGLFDVHDLERDHPELQIPDRAFEQLFAFFDAYQWHLDDRPLRNDKEINPDVLGYIFEKYINQKQMGAYYTKEDITGYISRNTIMPFLFNRAKKHCPIAFAPGGGVWRLLSDDPDKYFYEAVRHGITFDIQKKEDLEEKRELPPEIAAGLNDVSQRGGWNKVAPSEYALPTETWREHVARRQRYQDIRAKLARRGHLHQRPYHLQPGYREIRPGRDYRERRTGIGPRFLEGTRLGFHSRPHLWFRRLPVRRAQHPGADLYGLPGGHAGVLGRSGTLPTQAPPGEDERFPQGVGASPGARQRALLYSQVHHGQQPLRCGHHGRSRRDL